MEVDETANEVEASGEGEDEEEIAWQSEGHEWVGQKFFREVDDVWYPVAVTKWVPTEGNDEALWHVEVSVIRLVSRACSPCW